MKPPRPAGASRRDFLRIAGAVTGASALAGAAIPRVHVAGDDSIRLALIGCGGRGGGAIANALSVKTGPMKLVALADAFADRLKGCHDALTPKFAAAMDVPEERRFTGWDSYRKAMDCLAPGDIAVLATPPAFRWVHFKYAIAKGLHVFMEKPVTVDGPTSRRMLELGAEADAKGLKVAVGLMVRHCRGRIEMHDRIRSGEIGDVLLLRANRLHGPVGWPFSDPKPPDVTDLDYQVRRFHSFLWASGGLFSDFYIHQVDECCWMKGAWPVRAHAVGGRHWRGKCIDQNFDSYGVEYVFEDGARFFLNGRTMDGCHDEFSSFAHGSKGSAVITAAAHTPGRAATYKGQIADPAARIWGFPEPEPNPYQLEWEDFTEAIRNGRPYSELARGVQASLVTSLGRMAAHTGRMITLDEIRGCDHEFAPGLDTLTAESPAPLLPDAGGRYPVPEPGIKTRREY